MVALGVFGVPYVRALTTDRTTAEMRDDALIGAQQVAINLNNADSANLDQSIENMRSSVTGDEMTTYLQTVQDSITDELRNSGSKADTEVVQSALTELNTDDRTATALVVVRVTTTQATSSSRISSACGWAWSRSTGGSGRLSRLIRSALGSISAPAPCRHRRLHACS